MPLDEDWNPIIRIVWTWTSAVLIFAVAFAFSSTVLRSRNTRLSRLLDVFGR